MISTVKSSMTKHNDLFLHNAGTKIKTKNFKYSVAESKCCTIKCVHIDIKLKLFKINASFFKLDK